MGKVKWLISGEELPGRMEGDPIRYGLGASREELEEIEVLLVQGDWDIIGHQLWTMKSLKTILKFDTSDIGCNEHRVKRRRTRPRVPEGWKTGGKRIFHQANGGVTNGVFKL